MKNCAPICCSRRNASRFRTRGFTLLELLVVVGLIAVMSFAVFSAWTIGGRSGSLQTGQAILTSMVTASRTKAPATGRKVRLLIATDPAIPERYLKMVLIQLAREPGASPSNWETAQSVMMPDGVYVVPGALTGLVAEATMWRRTSDPSAELHSDLFINQNLLYALPGEGTPRRWTGVAFTPNGTLAALDGGPPPRGTIVLAAGRGRAPGTFAPTDPPVELIDPGKVRGVVLSAYGVPAPLDDFAAF